jgi:hypothetical protein
MSPHRTWGSAVNLLDVTTNTRVPVDFGTPLWRATLEWARFHGIDPMRVPAGSVVERDAGRCEIRYDRTMFGDDGLPLVADLELVTERVAERGEAPPLPFPISV